MHDNNTYVPMNALIANSETNWTFTSINMSYPEIAKKGIVLWCIENLEGRWTMLGGNKFAFEDAQDATIFKIRFGLGN